MSSLSCIVDRGASNASLSLQNVAGPALAGPCTAASPARPQSGQAANFVCLTAPQARQHLRLEAADGAARMVTCRVVASRGHLHAVLFHDRQPPVLLQNSTATDLEVRRTRRLQRAERPGVSAASDVPFAGQGVEILPACDVQKHWVCRWATSCRRPTSWEWCSMRALGPCLPSPPTAAVRPTWVLMLKQVEPQTMTPSCSSTSITASLVHITGCRCDDNARRSCCRSP